MIIGAKNRLPMKFGTVLKRNKISKIRKQPHTNICLTLGVLLHINNKVKISHTIERLD